MRKMLLPLLFVVLITACKKETVSEQPQPPVETASSVAAKASDKITIWHYNANNNTWKQTSINANAWPEHQAHGDIWKVGQDYKGGKIGYILQAGDPGYDANVPHGLIAAENDLNIDWSEIPGEYAYWYGRAIIDYPPQLLLPATAAKGTAIGTGMSNTTTVAQNLSILSDWVYANYPWSPLNGDKLAPYACDKLVLNGYTDWFLPSMDELKQIMVNRELIGGFAAPYLDYESNTVRATYWSSTAHGYGNSVVGDQLRQFANVCYYLPNTPANAFLTGTNYAYCKTRPVRYF